MLPPANIWYPCELMWRQLTEAMAHHWPMPQKVSILRFASCCLKMVLISKPLTVVSEVPAVQRIMAWPSQKRAPGHTRLLAAVVVLSATSVAWTCFSYPFLRAKSCSKIKRRFIGDLFGESSSEASSADQIDEVFEEEPGRGGPYAPAGFDTKRMQFDIVRYPHPALRQENEDIKSFDGRLRRLADNLFTTLYATGDGIGLAAPQVGINMRVMVYNPNPRTRDEETVFVNPRILSFGKEQDYEAEGCLSFPRIRGSVQRPTWVEVEARQGHCEGLDRKMLANVVAPPLF
eukprot:symbB.v1.2.002465.t1/scaffold99.1/size346285/21